MADRDTVWRPANTVAPCNGRGRRGLLRVAVLASGSILGTSAFAAPALAPEVLTGTDAEDLPDGRTGYDTDGDGAHDLWYTVSAGELTLAETDANRDGDVDNRTRFEGGAAVLGQTDADFDGRFESVMRIEGGRIVSTEVDADGNGRAEAVTHFAADGSVDHMMLDADGDGRREVRQVLRVDGSVRRAHLDADGDGFHELVDYFGAPGVVTLRVEDTDGDKALDRWSNYEEGRLVSYGHDSDGDGKPDRTEILTGDGSVRRTVVEIE